MQSKFVIVLLAFCVLANAARVKQSLLLERTISNMLMKSMEALASDAPNSAACFAAYRTKTKGHNAKFENAFYDCVDDAEAARENVQNELAADRFEMTTTSKLICSDYQNCNDDTTALGYFTCYSDFGDQAAKRSALIAFNATEAMQLISQRYSFIDGELEICIETCTYQYQTDMVKAQEELEACNKGKVTPA